MELADQQNLEAEGVVTDANIPSSPETDASPAVASSAPEKPLSIREQILKAKDSVAREEATRARDTATGKFAKVEASAVEKPAAAEIPEAKQNATPAESTPAAPPSAYAKIWDSMTPEAKAVAVRRETEFTKGIEEYRGKVKQYEAIEQIIAPARVRFQQQGAKSDAEAIHNLITWEHGLNNPATRVTAFRDLAARLQIDLSTLAQNPSQAPSAAQDSIPEPLRPVLDQFGNDLNSVKQELQTFRTDRISQELSTFASKPEHVHFDKVRVIMGQLMTSGIVPPDDLEGAYQKATTIHPEVSAQIESEKSAKAAAELARTQAERATKARLAAVSPAGRSPNGAPANGTAPKANKGVRGDILASIQALREGERA